MEKKKILIVDDSALMRRVICDIINSDDRFEVANMATDGAEGFKYVCSHTYDAVVLDVYMPRMTGLQMLEEMQKSNVRAKVLMSSTTTGEGARETLDALALGAIDFIKKPENVANARNDEFKNRFLGLLYVVACAPMPKSVPKAQTDSLHGGRTFTKRYDVNFHTTADQLAAQRKGLAPAPGAASQQPAATSKVRGRKIVALASSTGGPRALQDVVPYLPKDLPCPMLIVQHMPAGFTATLADRLNELSEVTVTEAKEGDVLEKGHVYVAPGGKHLKIEERAGQSVIKFGDEPPREGVKPCANYMYESLINSNYDEIVCVVLTGMGADGTKGIVNLSAKKRIFVIAQDEETCTVYGMPKSIAQTGLTNSVVPLTQVANQISKNLGVR